MHAACACGRPMPPSRAMRLNHWTTAPLAGLRKTVPKRIESTADYCLSSPDRGGSAGDSSGDRRCIAIDLKSFYASVECIDRGLDPLTDNLVVADKSRTEKTICLAVSPALKAFGVPGRPRLFEVVRKVREINVGRRRCAPGRRFAGKSVSVPELNANPSLELDYVVAAPRMARYMQLSSRIYSIYLEFIDPADILVYSVDEVFIDATPYLRLYRLTAHELAMKLISEVLSRTGITATAGVGTNLYLAKVAMDIVAKHMPADRDGVRIAELDELTYRERLWGHQPLTDFWQIGSGYAGRLASIGIRTMGDVARRSLVDEDVLYGEFGVDAELLIDHAWGWEPCTVADVKACRPSCRSISSGQVLSEPYDCVRARTATTEMAEQLALDLVENRLVADQLVLDIGYDHANISDAARRQACRGAVTTDRYGRRIPKESHGSTNLGRPTSSSRIIIGAMMKLYDRIANPQLLIRRINVAACRLAPEDLAPAERAPFQPDLFADPGESAREADEAAELARDRQLQRTIVGIKRRMGKNALLKGTNLLDGATARERNNRIGGHRR